MLFQTINSYTLQIYLLNIYWFNISEKKGWIEERSGKEGWIDDESFWWKGGELRGEWTKAVGKKKWKGDAEMGLYMVLESVDTDDLVIGWLSSWVVCTRSTTRCGENELWKGHCDGKNNFN